MSICLWFFLVIASRLVKRSGNLPFGFPLTPVRYAHGPSPTRGGGLKFCHCEPFRETVWQSAFYLSKNGDRFTKEFAMTGFMFRHCERSEAISLYSSSRTVFPSPPFATLTDPPPQVEEGLSSVIANRFIPLSHLQALRRCLRLLRLLLELH